MARGDQLARQWKIIQSMSAAHQGKAVAALAQELDCSPRTVYRDLEALQVAGFPIYTDRVEGRQRWSLLDTELQHIPVPFSLPELMALYFSRGMVKIFKGTVFSDSLESLFKKIKTTLPPESLAYLRTMEQTFRVSQKPYKDYSQLKETINHINQAAFKKKSLDIVYYTMSREEESRRIIDPYGVWFFQGTFYLIAFCHVRSEIRIFAVDRIKELCMTDQSFTVRSDFDLETFMKPSFGVVKGPMTRIRLRFDHEIAGYIKEKVWHESQTVTSEPDGSLLFEAEVAGTDEVKAWILSWGSRVEVLEPALLRKEVTQEARLMQKRYGNN